MCEIFLDAVGSGRLINAGNLIHLSDQPQPNNVGVSPFHFTILSVSITSANLQPLPFSFADKLLAVQMRRSSPPQMIGLIGLEPMEHPSANTLHICPLLSSRL